jgi:hypothetical protein
MTELIGKLLNKHPEARPDAESLIFSHKEIRDEVVKIVYLVSKSDNSMG